MTIPDSTVAVIGTGNIGSRLAANFAAGGQDFLLADRDQGTAAKIASRALMPSSDFRCTTGGRSASERLAARGAFPTD